MSRAAAAPGYRWMVYGTCLLLVPGHIVGTEMKGLWSGWENQWVIQDHTLLLIQVSVLSDISVGIWPQGKLFCLFFPMGLKDGMNCRYWVIIKALLKFCLLLCVICKLHIPCVFQFLICFYLLSPVWNFRQAPPCYQVSSYILELNIFYKLRKLHWLF